MSFFISDAMASAPAAPDPILSFLPLILLFVVFYFLLIRPQQKRQKEHRAMVEAISKGDECVTNGGILGRVVDSDESFITLQIAQNVEVKVQRQAIGSVMPKGTLKLDKLAKKS